jgi:hypothetical protein
LVLTGMPDMATSPKLVMASASAMPLWLISITPATGPTQFPGAAPRLMMRV